MRMEDDGKSIHRHPYLNLESGAFYEELAENHRRRDKAREEHWKERCVESIIKYQSERFSRSYYMNTVRPLGQVLKADFSDLDIGTHNECDYHFVLGTDSNNMLHTQWEYRIQCGPRFCGQINYDTLNCNHGLITWGGKQPPPGCCVTKGWAETNPFLIETQDPEKVMWYLYDEEKKVMVENPECKMEEPFSTAGALTLKVSTPKTGLPNIPEDIMEVKINEMEIG